MRALQDESPGTKQTVFEGVPMSKESMLPAERVTRYNLTIAFEELYTQEDSQLHAAANGIGVVASAIEELLTTDMALQKLLKLQNLQLNIIAPVRVSKFQESGAVRENELLRSNDIVARWGE
jgi:hypothetical protein